MSVAGRLARNTALSWTRSLIAAALQVYLVRFQLAHLGLGGYGTVEVIASIVMFAYFSNLGLMVGLSQSMAREVAHNDWKRLNEYFNTATVTYLVLGLVLSSLFIVFAPELVSYLEVEPPQWLATVRLVRFYVPLVLLTYFVGPSYSALLEAYHRFDVQEWVNIVEVIVRTAGIIVLVLAGLGLYGWAIAMLFSRCVAVVWLAIAAHRQCPQLELNHRFANRAALGALYGVGVFLLSQTLVAQANLIADPLIISRFLGPDGVAVYKPALLVVLATSTFVWGLSRQLRPLVIGLDATGQQNMVREVVSRGTRVTFLVGIPFTVVLACFTPQIVKIWLGNVPEADVTITAQVLILLSAWSLASHVRSSQSFVLAGLSDIRLPSIVQLTATLLGLAMSVVLIYVFSARGWGLRSVLGAAIPPIVVGYAQVAILAIYLAVRTGGGVQQLLSAFVRPTVVLLITLAAGLPLGYYTPATFVAVAVSSALTGAAWLLTTWFIGFDSLERSWVAGRIRNTLHGLPRSRPARS